MKTLTEPSIIPVIGEKAFKNILIGPGKAPGL